MPTTSPSSAQVRLLREVVGLGSLSLDQQLRSALALTADLLGLEAGMLLRLEPGEDAAPTLIVGAASAGIAEGTVLQLRDTFCEIGLERDDVFAVQDAAESEVCAHRCHTHLGVRAYIGLPVRVRGRVAGTLCFTAPEPRPTPFTAEECDLLRVLGSWVGLVVERTQASRALRRAQTRLQTVVENAPLVLFAVDDAGCFTLLEGKGLEGLGVAPGDRMGEPWDGRDRALAPLVNGRRRDLRREAARWTASLGGRTFESQLIPVHGPDGETDGLIGLALDVTEREADRAAAVRAADAQAEAVRAKERFLANMSHEMRTPLHAVTGLTDLLARTALDADQDRLVQGVSAAARALLSLIDDLLDFARLGADQLPFESVPFNPAAVVADVVAMLQAAAAEKRIVLRSETGAHVPALVVGDPTRFRQVVLNLVANAVKFTGAGGVFVRLDIEGGALAVAVTDTGIGIPPDRLGVIFDPFTQAADDAARRFGGTGLGLAIVRELVERQGGTVEVESLVDHGSTFTIVLPVVEPDGSTPAAPEPAPEPEEHGEPADIAGMHVLLVEDNPMNRFVATQLLGAWGVRVTEAEDGEAGVRAVAGSDAFDMVLMDLQMPRMDGIAATRFIRESLGIGPETLPIVALTASVLAYQQPEVRASGLDDFLLKPFAPDALRALLARHDRRTPAADAAATAAVDAAVLDTISATPELAVQIASMFVEHGGAAVAQMQKAAAADDLQAVGAAAHVLVGQAGYVGAHLLVASAQALDTAARQGGPAPGGPSLPSLVAEVVRRFEAAATELVRLYPPAPTAITAAA